MVGWLIGCILRGVFLCRWLMRVLCVGCVLADVVVGVFVLLLLLL